MDQPYTIIRRIFLKSLQINKSHIKNKTKIKPIVPLGMTRDMVEST